MSCVYIEIPLCKHTKLSRRSIAVAPLEDITFAYIALFLLVSLICFLGGQFSYGQVLSDVLSIPKRVIYLMLRGMAQIRKLSVEQIS
jgi:hypothetical protein